MTDTRWCAQHNCPSTLCGGSHREFREEQRRRAAPLIAEELRRLADDLARQESEGYSAFATPRAVEAMRETMAMVRGVLRSRADQIDPP